AEWRGVLKAGLITACAGALWHVAAIRFSSASGNVTPFASAVFILPALIGLIIRDCRRETRGQGDREKGGGRDKETKSACLLVSPSPCHPVPLSLRILLVIAVFGFVAILRVILNVAMTGPYAPFYLPALIIVYLYLLFRVAPTRLAKTDPIRANIRRAAM